MTVLNTPPLTHSPQSPSTGHGFEVNRHGKLHLFRGTGNRTFLGLRRPIGGVGL